MEIDGTGVPLPRIKTNESGERERAIIIDDAGVCMEHERMGANMKRGILYALAALLLLSGCGGGDRIMDGDGMENSYTQISQSEAKEMMRRDDGHVIVDVRRQDEYDAGHIPDAILIPNESIGDTQPEALPDLDQVILIYCRSGNRSKQAAQKLFDMGYTRIYEFGGILTWDGEIVTETAHDPADAVRPVPTLVIEANDTRFYATMENNSSAQAFAEKLSSGEIEIDMQDYGGFEKVGELPWALPQNDETVTAGPGDVILYQGNKITIYYGENTWDFTRLAQIGGATKEALLEALGAGDVSVALWVEWSE